MTDTPDELAAALGAHESLFTQLAHAMRLDDHPHRLSKAAQRELDALHRIALPPLALPASRPARRRPHWTQGRSLVALAAAIAFMVIGFEAWPRPEAGEAFRGKGAATVKLFWQPAGAAGRAVETREFGAGHALQNGDRVLAEVLAATPAVAYWGVLDAQGMLLGSWDDVRGSRMDLDGGQRRTFPASLELVGANDGETLFVLVCPPASADPFKNINALKSIDISSISNCKSWNFHLR